uniref:Uncharacterized protein n=1 Tax=Bos indicus x Bos taurus TaxID=30522 RepID=A0A4W2CTP8_BOBOX
MAPLARALVTHGLLDAVHLLLVPTLVLHGTLLGLLQCVSSQSSAPRVASSPARRSVSGTFSPGEAAEQGKGWAFVFSFSFSYFFFHCSAVNSRFTEAVFLMGVGDPATDRCPNIRVDLVSASLKLDGEQQMNIVVRQFPPKESWRIRVILLSRYGT